MGIPDNSLLDLIEKVRSWVFWGTNDLSLFSGEFEMADNRCKLCSECEVNFAETCVFYHCRSCDKVLCGNCVGFASGFMSSMAEAVMDIKSCKFCSLGRKYSDKIYPSESPRQSPEPPSPNFIGERFDGYSPDGMTSSSFTSFTGISSPASVRLSFSRTDEDEGEDTPKHFFSPSSEYCNTSDVDSSSVSARHEFYSFKSVGSSPSDSPSRIHLTSNRDGDSVQLEHGGTPRYQIDGPYDPETSDDCANDLSIFRDHCSNLQKPMDFESNGLIWFPPPPDDEDDEAESNFFAYDDEDDDIGESGTIFSSSSSLSKEKQDEGNKEPLKAVVQGHFRALVSQLLQVEGIKVEDWLDIVTTIAWQAANFVKPDTSRGGSMDPGDYVKIKCIASGSPSESTFIKGVVCTKNIKHKRMMSQYKNPRLLLLGGALEYQRVTNQLASFDTLLQQEIDHLKMIVSKIEAHHPNVLLVEKSVSSYAQEYLLAKEISLVLNVKKPLLERIARCTGALITPSIDNISTARLGHCEIFHVDKVSEELETVNPFNKKPSKTLMFFEGCPRRLGCTVLLKGLFRDELKKVKHVVQYAVFAAYHLSLETSFLADEGATLPKMEVKPSISVPESSATDNVISVLPCSVSREELLSDHPNLGNNFSPTSAKCKDAELRSDQYENNIVPNVGLEDLRGPTMFPSEFSNHTQKGKFYEKVNPESIDGYETSSEYYSAADSSHQSILVSFSSGCVLNGTVCERSRLLRIKFYGCFDKPLGRYLRDDLFDQTSCCRSCKEPAEAHVQCYTHQQGNLTIHVRRLPSVKLPGERDGKIWMWHRCLRCAHRDGVPPATRRVVMSDAAWGLSFGKFLELSFSNHATANRVASCGHSLQRDCLRYYGFGSMVAFFRYSPIDILSVRLPPSVLEVSGNVQQEWVRKEAAELLSKTEALYGEISGGLNNIEQKCASFDHEPAGTSELHDHIMELKDLLIKERDDYNDLLQPTSEETSQLDETAVDFLELNRLRHSLLIGSHIWDRRLFSLDFLLTRSSSSKSAMDSASFLEPKSWKNDSFPRDGSLDSGHEEIGPESSKLKEILMNDAPSEHQSGVPADSMSNPCHNYIHELDTDSEIKAEASMENIPSPESNLSDKIDSAWTGTSEVKPQFVHTDGPEPGSTRQINQNDNPLLRRKMSPVRVCSFDSALRILERTRKGWPPSSLHLTNLRSFHASGDYRTMIRDPVLNVQRSYSQMSPREAQKLKVPFISSVSILPDGVSLLLPQSSQSGLVIAVYENEPTSIISYALCSKEYEDSVSENPREETSVASKFSSWQSFGALDLDYINHGSYGSEDASSTIGVFFTDPKSSPHQKITFEDESSASGGKVKFSVTCYFAKHFDALRKKCCPSDVDFVRSLSRCKRWSAQGGKSNVYFAKSFDDRFIIKQVTKTELESFEEFAPEYFKYLTESLGSGSPTCLAKILGIFQVTVKNLKGGKETKMDLMIMENLFFERSISRVYDLKGSARSRYNSDTSGTNKVLLDMNLLETLRTKPIFLGSKAKRSLERAVWNDTSFLASVDVMDYSLLVGVDEERKELVLGIIDFMRQYTWDKHLETWVKASGILGGPKNASPTIISPKQYKRRFRKAMTSYFLTVPDQWSS